MRTRNGVSILAFIVAIYAVNAYAQESGYTFTDKIDIEVTTVKDQHRSGTCWSFAAISFLEAELMRTGKGEYDLSEMFLVRNCYSEKAE